MTDFMENDAQQKLLTRALILAACIFVLMVSYRMMQYPYHFFSDQIQHFPVITNKSQFFFYFPKTSRFFPLYAAEYYPLFISNLSKADIAFYQYLIQAVKFALFCLSFIFILFHITTKARSLILFFVFFLLAYDINIVKIFSHTIFPESSLLLMLSLGILAFLKAIENNKTILFLASFLCFTYALYLKEPVFSIIIILALSRLIFFYKAITKKEFVYQILLLISCAIFIFLYFKLAYVSSGGYNEGRVSLTKLELLIDYFVKKIYTLPLVLLLLYRSYKVFIKRNPVQLSDIFAVMAFVYTLCYYVLHLKANYYFTPAYFLSFIAFAYYLNNFRYNRKKDHTKDNAKKIGWIILTILIITTFFVSLRSANSFSHHKVYYLEVTTIYDSIKEKNIPFALYDQDTTLTTTYLTWFLAWHENKIDSTTNLLPTQDEFEDFLAKGGISIIANTVSDFDEFTSNPKYIMLPCIIGGFYLIYDAKFAKEYNPFYCEFANAVEKTFSRDFLVHRSTRKIYAARDRLDCKNK